MQHTRTPCNDHEENDKCEHSTCSALLLGSLVFYMEQDNHKYGLLVFCSIYWALLHTKVQFSNTALVWQPGNESSHNPTSG